MEINGSSLLVTGANRGIGAALVESALERGARRVYAAARAPINHSDDRVVPLVFDLTDRQQLAAAAELVDDLDVVINNAGIAGYDDLTDLTAVEQHFDVNVLGTLAVIQTFRDKLVASKGAIVNVSSIAALAALPIIPSYSISKAALLSMSQSLRALLAADGVAVHVVLPGPVDTEMSAGLDVPKASARSVADRILEGIERGEEEIFPDSAAEALAPDWAQGVTKVLERANFGLLALMAE
jgi:NAD(P)-dependent dehydrogenase (short-subunit alcohol dehydrogenase family)